MTYTYRPSKGSDAIACATIIREWGEETPWMAPLDDLEPMAASWQELLEIDSAWTVEKAGKVAGFCVRENDNITGLYVARNVQSCGVGKALLDFAKVGRDWITVWVYEKNTRAVAFYHREGLAQIGRKKDEHSDLLYLECRWNRSS